MKLLGYIFIFFISIFINIKVHAVPTFENNFSITNENKTATGVIFNPSGTKMYVVGILHSGNNASIAQYSLSEPFNVASTVTLDENLVIFSQEQRPQGIKFNANGTKVLVLGTDGDGVDVWDLTTPYDISTLTLTDTSFTSIGGNPRGFDFNNDGTKMFVLQLDELQEYSLSTAFDPSTKGTAKTFSIPAVSNTAHQGFAFNNDGRRMYVTRSKTGSSSNSLNIITEYDLTKSFDISSAIESGTYNSSAPETHEYLSGVTFNSTGSKLYYINFNSDEVRQFSLSCSYGVVNCMDPTADKDDVASVEAQTEFAKELIQHTTYPVLNRMEWLRRNKDNRNLTNQNIKLQFSNEVLASLSEFIIPTYINDGDSLTEEDPSGNFSFWSEGTISVGKVGDTLMSSSKNINTSAITIGVDRRDSEERMYGLALRFGNDDIDFGSVKNSLDMNAVSLTLYGSH